MANSGIKSRLVWTLAASAALYLSYLLFRYPLFGLHGMSQWTFILLMFGLIVIGIAALKNARSVMVCVVAGYLIGFVLHLIFGREYWIAAGDDLLIPKHNGWWIWTIAYLLFIAAGILWDVICKRIQRRKASKQK